MFPQVKLALQASADVRALLGNSPRVFKHGEAPQNVEAPYAVWIVVSGVPENSLGETPSIDRDSVQLDVYGKTQAEVEQVARACRDQLETVTHMTAWRNPPRDADSRLYRVSMDFDFWLPRDS